MLLFSNYGLEVSRRKRIATSFIPDCDLAYVMVSTANPLLLYELVAKAESNGTAAGMRGNRTGLPIQEVEAAGRMA